MPEPTTPQSRTAAPRLCEFSSRPFDDCYCCNITGRTVLKVATYCMERYRECPVYQRMVGQGVYQANSETDKLQKIKEQNE